MSKITRSKVVIPKTTTSNSNTSKIIDVFGEYEPTVRCACIDERTLTNINHSLKILYSDKTREQKELKEIKDPSSLENAAMNINDLVMRRTKSLMAALKGIEHCKDMNKQNVAKI